MVITVDAYKIAYMALPKAACSSVKAGLALIDPNRPETKLEHLALSKVHGIYVTKRFRIYRFRQHADWWRFCVVRDPIKRLTSVYSDLVRGRHILENSRSLQRGDFDLPMHPDPDFFFSNLDAYMEAASMIKHHALKAWLFIGEDLSLYDRVYRVEELDDLARDLSDRTGTQATIPRFNESRERFDFKDLNRQTRASLTPFLEREYALMQAYYQPDEGQLVR